MANSNNPHAVCIPYPAQGHINPMLRLSKFLHFKGFHITFVNTEFNHKRLLKSRGLDSLNGLPTFQFKTIPDGLPPSEIDATQNVPALCESTSKTCLGPFRRLLTEINRAGDVPPVSCIVSDGCMSFTVDAAEEFGVPDIMFWTTSACGFLCYAQYVNLIEKGLTPLKDESYLTNGYLDTKLDWIPGIKEIRLRDFPTFIRTTNKDDILLNYVMGEIERTKRASAIILNTFEELEKDVLKACSSFLPPIFSIGPLHLLISHIPSDTNLNLLGSNLWKEEWGCLDWLESKQPNSVIYVNFGSVTVMTSEQLVEFAWGLANSNQTFFWVIRPDLVHGESAILPPEFIAETKNRGLLSSWCPQEKVLSHPAIGVFLTHSGWNSTLESISFGVPMICWPFFAEQQTNCRFTCEEWGIGIEIDNNVKRDEVNYLLNELMEGEKGKCMKMKARKWKQIAEESIGKNGSSYANFNKMINEILLAKGE